MKLPSLDVVVIERYFIEWPRRSVCEVLNITSRKPAWGRQSSVLWRISQVLPERRFVEIVRLMLAELLPTWSWREGRKLQ
jgi:hypothetical protein